MVALFLFFQSWERFQGHLYYLQVEKMKENWREKGSVPHDSELSEGFKLGYRALERERNNSEYRFMLASLHAWREKGLHLWPKQSEAEAEKVMENLKAALAQRPSWFEAWMLLALVKFQLNEIDQELSVALEKSIKMGKYETIVHHGVSIVGPRIFHRLGPELRDSVIETLYIALDNKLINRFVVERIVMSGLFEVFRSRLESDEDLKPLMNEYLRKRKEVL